MELMEAITHRRSVRKFTDYYVTDEEIREMLNAARLAQSWANTQVWEFIVVRDRDLIKKVTELLRIRGCGFKRSTACIFAVPSASALLNSRMRKTTMSETSVLFQQIRDWRNSLQGGYLAFCLISKLL